MKKILLLALLCGFIVTAAIGCGGTATTKPAPPATTPPATGK